MAKLEISVYENATVAFEIPVVDPEGATLTFSVSKPSHGAVTGPGPQFVYAPFANYVGADVVTVSISDGANLVPVEVAITVLGVTPVAADLSVDLLQDTDATVTLRATGAPGAALLFQVVDPPTHGALSGASPVLTYRPTEGFSGTDSFTYRAVDGAQRSNVATVTLQVDHVIRCGDGLVEGTEACDDANAVETDACRSTCVLAACGDGLVRAGVEACDDGNRVNNDGCRNDCVLPSCGDGVVQAGESCDDGNQVNTDACRGCMVALCGDGVVQAGVEACDDGNSNNGDACLNTCALAACGDGVVQAGVEACDDGNSNNGDACLNTCALAACGDGVVQAGIEACDDGNSSNGDACLNTCVASACGDGFVRAGVEQCDDANSNNGDACLNTCVASACGDGFVRAGIEQCDDGNNANTDACLNTCVASACGDGFVRTGIEQCDDGNNANTDACLNTCTAAICGDGFVQAGVEQCDDTNQVNGDGCSSTCQAAACGDGLLDVTEACDDGNTADDDGCSHRCVIERCGDRVVQLSRGETCDDGALVSGDGCDASCHSETFVTSAPVLVSGSLSCTTAVANATNKLAVDGRGVIYAGMLCGTSAFVAVSTNHGSSFSAPFDLMAAVPNAPFTVSQLALAATPSDAVFAAIMLDTGEVFLRRSLDAGATWSAATSVGVATSTSSGLSLEAFNDKVFVGYSTSGGVRVMRNFDEGVGPFAITDVAMSIAFFDLAYDPVTRFLAVAADTPSFHVRASTDDGASFAAEVTPPGQEFYSDWALGGGQLFSSGINIGSLGNSTAIYVIPTGSPSTSTRVTGLPQVNTAQTRSLAADLAGNVYVASQLNSGGVQLDQLPSGTTIFSTSRALSATGSSPVVAALPAHLGAVVEYVQGASVYVTVQAY